MDAQKLTKATWALITDTYRWHLNQSPWQQLMKNIGRVPLKEDEEAVICKHIKEQKLSQEIMAARKSRDWKDFVNTGSRTYGRDSKDHSKRVRRYIMVANAMLQHET